jgi:hypothetical protein
MPMAKELALLLRKFLEFVLMLLLLKDFGHVWVFFILSNVIDYM